MGLIENVRLPKGIISRYCIRRNFNAWGAELRNKHWLHGLLATIWIHDLDGGILLPLQKCILDNSINNDIILRWPILKLLSPQCGEIQVIFASPIFLGFVITTLVQHGIRGQAIGYTKRRGQATRESTFKTRRERQKTIR